MRKEKAEDVFRSQKGWRDKKEEKGRERRVKGKKKLRNKKYGCFLLWPWLI